MYRGRARLRLPLDVHFAEPAMNEFVNVMLARVLSERDTYRLMLLAALDAMHELQTDNAVQARIIQQLREELRERMGVPTNGELR